MKNIVKNLLPLFISLFILTIINLVPYWYRITFSSVTSSDLMLLIKCILYSLYASSLTLLLMINIRKVNLIIAIFLSSFWLFSTYMYINFGGFDLSVLSSILETTKTESIEYVKDLHLSYFLLLVIPYFYITYRIKDQKNKPHHNKALISFTLLSFFLLTFSLIKSHQYDLIPKSILSRLNIYNFYDKVSELIEVKEQDTLKITPEWKNVKPRVDTLNYNYIMIIGESAPRKSFSYYNNEDLKKYYGWTFISNAISPATNTRESIPRILSLNNYENINDNLNLIDLANEAGLTTYWFSNQGFMGKFDTPISKIAKRCQHVLFHNKGDYRSAGSDDRLLEDLKKTIINRKTGNLVFLHTLGSHPAFCKRTVFYKKHIKNFNPEDEHSCFKDAIYNTELYISEVNNTMKSTGKPYKIIYFSDHGLTDVDYPPYKVHGVGVNFSLDAIHIPLIFINSENKKQGQMINKTYYMRDFTNTFADWIDVNASQLKNNKSIYSNKLNQKHYIYQGSKLTNLG
ncbi:TPA: sulfatase-like hydrolase/transferase [Photobacterium damselae]|uniref:sulfatase-like hydrolase/transferase n=1 Tax=Photobacterium damselae TaxID=38293 RepID=UPI00370AD191